MLTQKNRSPRPSHLPPARTVIWRPQGATSSGGPQHHSCFPEPSFLKSCFPLERRPRNFSLAPCGPSSSILGKLSGLGAQGQPGVPAGPGAELAQSCNVREKGQSQSPTPCSNLIILQCQVPIAPMSEPWSRTRALPSCHPTPHPTTHRAQRGK